MNGSKSSVFARPCLVVGSKSASESAASGTNPILRCFPARLWSSPGRFSGFRSLDCGRAGPPLKSSGGFGSLSGSPEFSAGLVRISGVCDVQQLNSGRLSQEVLGHAFRTSVSLSRDSSPVVQEPVHLSEPCFHSRTLQVYRKVFQLWGSPLVDLFATALTCRLPLYVSPLPDQEAWRQDAFSFSWDGLDLYAFPPFALIRRVLVRVCESQAVHMTLVAPLWPQGDWFPLLLDLLMDKSWVLPMWQSLLQQPHRPLFHGSPEKLHLYAWQLSSVSSEREVFRARLLNSCLDQ
ncbi:hypothetical protein E2C01_048282 [Portunus trituberculatus]|uniref:Uncharacterized protein n=1 Tax=Portunus trituberculatus TaxID=210409 RepID=A0A5B7G3E3_PORTR|nr:hypothetical protein [Portunus trituberculatus]